jgi:hypothetical protein
VWWGNQDRMDLQMDTWAFSSMLVLSLVMTLPFLWYAKRMTEAIENVAEIHEQELLLRAPSE